MLIDKNTNHFHLETKFIEQAELTGFSTGKFVYLDVYGTYKLAYPSTDVITSCVQGVIWEIIGDIGFYLNTSFGPLKYRFPYGPEYFNKVDGVVVEDSVNDTLIPGILGEKLWLSTDGGVKSTRSTILLGYKTTYGMIYRPEFIDYPI